jgi:hypothetical protein
VGSSLLASLLASSNASHGAVGSSSDDSLIGLFSEGRLSPSKLCISGRMTPR